MTTTTVALLCGLGAFGALAFLRFPAYLSNLRKRAKIRREEAEKERLLACERQLQIDIGAVQSELNLTQAAISLHLTNISILKGAIARSKQIVRDKEARSKGSSAQPGDSNALHQAALNETKQLLKSERALAEAEIELRLVTNCEAETREKLQRSIALLNKLQQTKAIRDLLARVNSLNSVLAPEEVEKPTPLDEVSARLAALMKEK